MALVVISGEVVAHHRLHNPRVCAGRQFQGEGNRDHCGRVRGRSRVITDERCPAQPGVSIGSECRTPRREARFRRTKASSGVTVNATIAAARVSVTPSFIGDQPSSYQDASGATVVPLGDIQDEAFALVNSFDDTQKKAAVLGSTPIDLVLGPGEDGKTIAPEGIPGSQLTPAQQAAALKLIGHYTGMVDDADAAARRAEVTAGMAQTYFAWYGPTTAGGAAYFRFTGPTLVVEYAPQGDPQGDKTPTNAHIHGMYRDPTNEYGAKYAS